MTLLKVCKDVPVWTLLAFLWADDKKKSLIVAVEKNDKKVGEILQSTLKI